MTIWTAILAGLGLGLIQLAKILRRKNQAGRKMIFHADVDLEKVNINETNIFELEFNYHSTVGRLYENPARIKSIDYAGKTLTIEVINNILERKQIKEFNLALSKKTFNQLVNLSREKVFKDKFGDDYDYFLSCYHDYRILEADESSRKYSVLTLTYRIKPENAMNKKMKRMYFRKTMNWTVGEARRFKANTTYWKNAEG